MGTRPLDEDDKIPEAEVLEGEGLELDDTKVLLDEMSTAPDEERASLELTMDVLVDEDGRLDAMETALEDWPL